MRVNESRTRSVDRVFDVIRPAVAGRSVLHLGCVAHNAEKMHGGEAWMHGLIEEVAESCVGVDIDSDGVSRMRNEGYETVCADVQELSLDREFETIVAGEIIEHLVDFDGFVRSLLSHLEDAPDAQIVITTPNAMALHWTILRLLSIDFVNTEHTCWFDETTLSQLFSRYDTGIVDITYVGDCNIRLMDPLFSAGRIAEILLPDRVGKSTLVAFLRPER